MVSLKRQGKSGRKGQKAAVAAVPGPGGEGSSENFVHFNPLYGTVFFCLFFSLSKPEGVYVANSW